MRIVIAHVVHVEQHAGGDALLHVDAPLLDASVLKIGGHGGNGGEGGGSKRPRIRQAEVSEIERIGGDAIGVDGGGVLERRVAGLVAIRVDALALGEDAVGGAKHGASAQGFRAVGQADARIEIAPVEMLQRVRQVAGILGGHSWAVPCAGLSSSVTMSLRLGRGHSFNS